MKKVALVTCRELATLLEDEILLTTALKRYGIEAGPEVWDDPDADWLKYDLVLIRTTWDYSERHEEFLRWLEMLESRQVNVLNPIPILRWNLNKRYLFELRNRGANLLETMAMLPGDPWTLDFIMRAEMFDEVVIKPVISAGARDTWRVKVGDAVKMQDQWARQLAQGELMIQEYAPEIVKDGEWSLIFFDGEFSHALVKKPKPGDFRVQAKHGGRYELRTPTPALIEQARAVLDLLEGMPLYARVDGIIRYNQLFLMELELLEPQLFFSLAPEQTDRLAAAIVNRLAPGA